MWKGQYRGRAVAARVSRVHRTSDLIEIKSVGLS